jgi:predicted DNA-binding antitoxin AbrB/MazE fold protein
MSNQKVLATYANGVFRPVDPDSLGLSEGQNVVLNVEPIDRATYILSLAGQVYEGLSEEEIEAIEQAIRRRPLFSNEEIEEKQSVDQTS